MTEKTALTKNEAKGVRYESMSLADLELWQAVHLGDPAAVGAALGKGGDPSSVSERGEGLLARAARVLGEGAEGHRLACLNRLLEAGADPESLDSRGLTALSLAALGAKSKAVEALLKAGASVGSVCDQGFAPLHRAAESGSEAAILALLVAGAELEAKNKFGETALWVAAARGQSGAVGALLRAGADPKGALSPPGPPLKGWIRSVIEAALAREEMEAAASLGESQGRRQSL